MLSGKVDKITLVIFGRISLHYTINARGSLIKESEMRVEADGKTYTLSNTDRNSASVLLLILIDQSQGACEAVCCRCDLRCQFSLLNT